jgi:hypothetical protein
MKTCFKVLISVIALSVFLTGLAFAYQFRFGALLSDVAYEDKLSFGGPLRRFNLPRSPFEIPKAYGRLVAITASDKVTTLWFEANDGSIRNVNLSAEAPIIIDRKGELNADAR